MGRSHIRRRAASTSSRHGKHFSGDPTFNAQYQRIVEGLRKAGLPEGMAKTN
jgi:hypothetical protein